MEDGLLSLKWNNHKSTFFHILSSLRRKETYTDATLACEGKFFPVHKLVMSTCSDYFCEVFERTNCKSPVVILKDIKHHDLEALLDYMYLGEVDVKQSELAGLIKSAECLRIKGLAVPDEDPTQKKISEKKNSHVPENRSSPSAKRLRRESGGVADMQATPRYGVNRMPLSPSKSHSSTTITSISVPSQSLNSDSLSNVPSLSMLPPPYSDSGHSDLSSAVNETQKHLKQSNIVPVDMIKVEIEDEGKNSSFLKSSQEISPDQIRVEQPSGDERVGGGEGTRNIRKGRDKGTLSNNFSEFVGSEDQIDTFNESDQIPGPSGVQGGTQMMNWGEEEEEEEEGNFPHNLFGSEDSHQQVNWNLYQMINSNEISLHIPLEDRVGTLRTLKSLNCISVNDYDETLDDKGFEGFEADTVKLSELKRKLLYSKCIEFTNNKISSQMYEETSVDSASDFQDYTPFEILAQEFEEELGLIPCEVSFNENKVEHNQQLAALQFKQKFICYQCNNYFKSKKHLTSHINNPKSCSFSCPICPYKGKDIMSHLSFHSNINAKGVLVCLLCQKTVISLDDLMNHLKLNHSY